MHWLDSGIDVGGGVRQLHPPLHTHSIIYLRSSQTSVSTGWRAVGREIGSVIGIGGGMKVAGEGSVAEWMDG